MQFFYDPTINPHAAEHTLSADESRHAVRVLRLGAGARLHLVDGRGTLYETEIVAANERACTVRVVASTPDYGRRPYRLVLAVAPTKNSDRMEWLVEKATEIGLDALVPLECANSERRVWRGDRAVRVAVSAMKQSLKARLPEIAPLTPLRELLARPFDGLKLIAHCREEVKCAPDATADAAADGDADALDATATASRSLATDAPSSLAANARTPITELLRAGVDTMILIGPEGDFTEEEVASALKAGFQPISLGESRLRTETAALTATTAVYLANLR